MALVSGGRSTLNPNAPLFIPAAVRQVEDFSPEWWDLVTTATWFRDYWLSQHQGEDIFGEEDNSFYGDNIVGLLPDNIDLDVDDDILTMEAQFEEFLQASEAEYMSKAFTGATGYGLGKKGGTIMKSLSLSLSMPKERGPKSPKYWEKPAKRMMSPNKHSPRFIHQPR